MIKLIIKNGQEVKVLLRAIYEHDFYEEADKRNDGDAVYVFTKEESFPDPFISDLKEYNSNLKITSNKVGLKLKQWKDFIENVAIKNEDSHPVSAPLIHQKTLTTVNPANREGIHVTQLSELKKISFDVLQQHVTYDNQFLLNKAIEKFLDANKERKEFSSEEKIFIRKYSGYGGLEKYGATGKEVLYEYYTPDKIIRKMWELAYKNGYKGGSVLEPAIGTGEFLRYVPEGTTGYEINPYSYRIAKILYPKVNLHHAAFETRFIKNNESIRNRIADLPKFNLVIGNPPYGEFTGRYAGMGEKSYTKAITYVEYFIQRGLDCLNEGGLLLYIIGVEVANGGIPFLQQGMTKAKEMIQKKGELLEDTYRLSNGLFERTDVLSEIIIFRRK